MPDFHMSQSVAYLSIAEASTHFRVSRRTIERKIGTGEIAQSQVTKDGRETKIYVNELVRVFGEPKPLKQSEKLVSDTVRHTATTRDNVADHAPESELVTLLKAQIEHERARAQSDREEAQQRIQDARERERAERDRAERYERELAELRKLNESLVQRLLPPPIEKPPEAPRGGFLARLFGR
jgi:hypothetical protein